MTTIALLIAGWLFANPCHISNTWVGISHYPAHPKCYQI